MKKLSYTIAAFAATFFAHPRAHLSLIPIAAAQSASELVGRWEGQGLSDSGAKQYVVLELRADSTYTKTLDAVVNGQRYGGTHSGTWKSRGSFQIHLSGDGNWPAYTQDLKSLRKVK